MSSCPSQAMKQLNFDWDGLTVASVTDMSVCECKDILRSLRHPNIICSFGLRYGINLHYVDLLTVLVFLLSAARHCSIAAKIQQTLVDS